MNNKILIVAGDPNSINSEIIFKSFKKLNNSIRKKIYVLGNCELIEKQLKQLKYKLKLSKVKNINQKNNVADLKIVDLGLNFKNPFKVEKKEASNYVIRSLNMAHKIAIGNRDASIINCPVNKDLLKKGKIGVTEYLASKCGIKDNSEVMLIFNKSLSVSPVTTHIDIKDVAKKLNSKNIIKKSQTINRWFKNIFNKKPKIGILGLNPHNAELRINSEEIKIIRPAIKRLKELKIDAYGPLVADSIFINEYKKYDVIIGMYHDQVLTPFKALYNFNAINITLGLKYLRLSPDHGTANNIIKKKLANEESLLNCIYLINKIKK